MLNENWFTLPPVHNGWYWYADKPEDWDLARPVPVQRIEYGTGEVFYQAYIDHRWQNVTEVSGIWAGPFFRPMRGPC
jgi:hypothetical protein